ncbi:MAG: proline dehydrogenase family protein [Thermoplasmata archaeon]|nr:proline dehydrogenase family protein [Thermoplasmata archaeon]
MTGERWAVHDLEAALSRCRARNAQGIRCILDVLGEEAGGHDQAERFVDAYIALAEAISSRGLDASVTVKVTALGAHVDTTSAEGNLMRVCRAARDLGVAFEVDMEGTPLVEHTIDAVLACVDEGLPATVALQAYLDRTPEDMELMVDAGVGVRLVKGAYMGDVTDHGEIQRRFVGLARGLLGKMVPFGAGTHDPVLVDRLLGMADDARDRFELSFLMGLADSTKERLASEGWRVAEYIPFGRDLRAYQVRRERYLKALDHLGLAPAQ